MNFRRYTCCFVFIFTLVFTGAFSLSWMRQQVYHQAQATKSIERAIASLTEANQRVDLYIAHLNNQYFSKHQDHTNTERILWISSTETSVVLSHLAFNH